MIEYQDLKNKYSIIIPYRDRKSHLELLLPRLQEIFKNKEYEIIISEQNDNNNFNLSNTQNIGVKYSKGNIIILHQVDYYPTDDVSYLIEDQPVLPARKGIFINNEFKLREINDIPGGYRKWHQEIDENFYGGVIIMKKEHWDKINGLNPLYKGWGNEDEDLRERLKWGGYFPIRNKIGTFLCLYHEDNGNMSKKSLNDQRDFLEGRKIYSQAFNYKHLGYKNVTADVEEYETGIENVRWIKSTNYQINL
jgi:predicted glycosyltransferase involved in capsule biosynthesis